MTGINFGLAYVSRIWDVTKCVISIEIRCACVRVSMLLVANVCLSMNFCVLMNEQPICMHLPDARIALVVPVLMTTVNCYFVRLPPTHESFQATETC